MSIVTGLLILGAVQSFSLQEPTPGPVDPSDPASGGMCLPRAGDFLTQEPAPPAAETQEKGLLEDVRDTLWTLGKTFVLDMGYLVTAPLRTTKEGLFVFVGGAAIIGVTMAELDEPIQGFALRNQHEDLSHFLGTVESATSRPEAWGFGLTALGLLVQDPHLERTGLEVIELDLVTKAVTNVGKRVFGRSRPYTGEGPHSFKFFGGTTEGRRSFPSDAASEAFSIAVPIAEEYPGSVWPYVAYTVAALSGIQRIYANDHWTSDVLTSALFSLAVGKALVWLHQQASYPPIFPWLAAGDGERVAGLAFETRF